VAFPTTRWSVVQRADSDGDDAARTALAELCSAYWFPLYAFVRRRGFTPHDAQDFTQGFFLQLIEGGWLNRADADRGRFRSYLLGALGHFLANGQRRQQTIKRGGEMQFVSIDELQSEGRYELEAAYAVTPEMQFDRSWAVALLERVLARLATDYEKAARPELFATLQPYLAGKAGAPDYDEPARTLSMSRGAVTVAIHRMRRRYGELLRDEIAQTVASPEEVEAEIAYLLRVIARG
jgi:RNA polymerase sigma-70 factor (ECF subfamily)